MTTSHTDIDSTIKRLSPYEASAMLFADWSRLTHEQRMALLDKSLSDEMRS